MPPNPPAPADLPPTIDARAASRWDTLPQRASPWLHEEVGRRMQERLQWIRMAPSAWLDWRPSVGGLQAHAAVAARYPKARVHVIEHAPDVATPRRHWKGGWRARLPWLGPDIRVEAPAPQSVQMVWANMSLHMAADPQAWLRQWHDWLEPDGFLMFSCLGPDTLRELRGLYAELGWPPPAHEFTDMHDWGDMLVQCGFAEPVMDMERIVLSFDSGERLLSELRSLGRNLHQARPVGLRGRGWRTRLLQALDARAVASEQRHQLSFEVIYGHALRGRPRVPVQGQAEVSLDQMRAMLRRRPG